MKFDINQANADRKARVERRANVRNQIIADQQANTKRDAKALAREAAWMRKNGQA